MGNESISACWTLHRRRLNPARWLLVAFGSTDTSSISPQSERRTSQSASRHSLKSCATSTCPSRTLWNWFWHLGKTLSLIFSLESKVGKLIYWFINTNNSMEYCDIPHIFVITEVSLCLYFCRLSEKRCYSATCNTSHLMPSCLFGNGISDTAVHDCHMQFVGLPTSTLRISAASRPMPSQS